jgi:hypothetical protein
LKSIGVTIPEEVNSNEIKLVSYLERLKFEAVRAAIGRSFIASNISIRSISS